MLYIIIIILLLLFLVIVKRCLYYKQKYILAINDLEEEKENYIELKFEYNDIEKQNEILKNYYQINNNAII